MEQVLGHLTLAKFREGKNNIFYKVLFLTVSQATVSIKGSLCSSNNNNTCILNWYICTLLTSGKVLAGEESRDCRCWDFI